MEEPAYVEMLMATGSADLGKVAAGQIVRTTTAQAERYVQLNVAKPSTREAYDKVRAEKEELDRRYQAELEAQAQARQERAAQRSEDAIKARIGRQMQRERELAEMAARDDENIARVAASQQTVTGPVDAPPLPPV